MTSWHNLDLDDLEALRRLDCQIAGLLGWQDAGLRFEDERDVLGEYKGVAPSGQVEVVPRFCSDWRAAAGLPVQRRIGKVWMLMASPLAVALIFLEQRAESANTSESASDVQFNSTSQARRANQFT